MKFFLFQTRKEGVPVPSAIFSFGKCIERERVNTMYGIGTQNDKYVVNGFYFRFMSPLTKNKQYTDSNTFNLTEGPCRFAFIFRSRTVFGNRKATRSYSTMWVPAQV